MSVKVDIRISPSLDPETYRGVDGYNELTAGYVDDVVSAFTDIYLTLGAIHNASDLAAKNPAWTPENRVLVVAKEARIQKERVSRRFDRACGDLAKRIAQTEADLRKPLTQQAAMGNLNAEVRQHAKALDRPERSKLLAEAFAANDDATLQAILGAQPFLSGLTQVDHEHYLYRYHTEKQPEVVQRLAVMRKIEDLAGRNSHLIHSAFEKAVGAKARDVRAIEEAHERAMAALKIEPQA